MGPDSENIPSERCGGEGRRANRKARYTTQSVAETSAYCTLNTVSIENAADILQTFANELVNCLLFQLIVLCVLHAVCGQAC